MTTETFEKILLDKGFIIDNSWKSSTSGYNKTVYVYEYADGDKVIIYSIGGLWWIQYRNVTGPNRNKQFNTKEDVLKFIEE